MTITFSRVFSDEAKCLTPLLVNSKRAADDADAIGTPRAKVAVIWVAESTTIESASISEKVAEASKSARSKFSPVNTIVFSPLRAAEVTVGKADAVTYS